MTDKEKEGFCTECRFEIDSFRGLSSCPNCRTKGIPSSYKNQVNISINWHELHILCVWAENYGRSIKQVGLIYGIAHAIESQFPEKYKLTLAGDFNELKNKFPNAKLKDEKGEDIQT